jgi:serine/threonine-protein kinase
MGNSIRVVFNPDPLDWSQVNPLPPEGPMTLFVRSRLDTIPEGSKFHGRLFIGRERIFGWVTELELPNGKRLPVCANVMYDDSWKHLGMPLAEGSTPEKPLFKGGVNLVTTHRLGVAAPLEY